MLFYMVKDKQNITTLLMLLKTKMPKLTYAISATRESSFSSIFSGKAIISLFNRDCFGYRQLKKKLQILLG